MDQLSSNTLNTKDRWPVKTYDIPLIPLIQRGVRVGACLVISINALCVKQNLHHRHSGLQYYRSASLKADIRHLCNHPISFRGNSAQPVTELGQAWNKSGDFKCIQGGICCHPHSAARLGSTTSRGPLCRACAWEQPQSLCLQDMQAFALVWFW